MESTGNIGAKRTDELARRAVVPAAPRPAQGGPAVVPGGPADAAGLAAGTALEAQDGPRGRVAMPGGPRGADAADFDGFDGFGVPGLSVAEARAYVQDALRALDGPPAGAVQAAAGLLGDPRRFTDALRQLATLRGTPEGAAVKAELDRLAARATPALLAAKLLAVADPAALPPATLAQLGRLRAVADPALQAALDRTAVQLLPQLSPERLVRDDALAALVAPLANSHDPQARAALARAVGGWTDAALTRALAGKTDAAGVKQALGDFEAEIVGLARATGLGAPLQAAAEQALQQRSGAIEAIAQPKKKKGFWGKITGAVSGVVEGVSNGIGGALKFAVDGIGKVAKVAIDVTAKVSTVGLDLTAAALDAAGADGAAAKVRAADRLVEKAYAAVGDQVQLFAEGVGSAFRDTVVGIGSTIAHPIETVKGIAHLVTHPGEIPKVAKALWDTATEKGPAYALGYVAGNLLPMVLSGGSSSGGSLGARIGAIAGESRLIGGALKLAGESRLVTGAVSVAKASGKAVAATRAGRVAIQGYEAFATVAGKARKFTTVPREFVGRLAAKSETIQRAVSYVKGVGARLEQTPAVRAMQRLKRAYEDRVVALNDKVDGALRAGLARAEGSGVGQRIVGKALPARAERIVQGNVQRDLAAGRELSQAERDILARRGDSLADVEEANRAGLNKLPDRPEQEQLLTSKGKEKTRAIYEDRDGARGRVGQNQIEDGVIFEGARPHGDMPNVRVDLKHPKLEAAREKALAIGRDATLSTQQKIDRIVELVRGEGDGPGLLRAASSSEGTNALFEGINGKLKGAQFRLEDLGTYLDSQVGDCRHFALTTQSLLQEAVPELRPRVVYAKTYETVANGVTEGVNHAFNVITIDGKDVVVDAILPHFTGGLVDDYVNRGLFGREARFVQDRFQPLAGRWSMGAGANAGTAFNSTVGWASLPGRVTEAWNEAR